MEEDTSIPTPLQDRIELSVTNGVGYRPNYEYVFTLSPYEINIPLDFIHDTEEGYQAYLSALNPPRNKKDQRSYFLFNSSGQRVDFYPRSIRNILKKLAIEVFLTEKGYFKEIKKRGGYKEVTSGFSLLKCYETMISNCQKT